MEKIITVDQIVSLVPEQERFLCLVGIALIGALFVATALIQWRRVRRLNAECKQSPHIQRSLMWIDWPCPLALLTLLAILAMARGLSWRLQIVMALVGFALGCFLAVLATRPPKPSQAAGKNRSNRSNQQARDKRGATLVFPSSPRSVVQATDGLESKENGPAVPLRHVSSRRPAVASAAEMARRD